MVSGAIQLTVNDHSLAFEPAHDACPDCASVDGFRSDVGVTTADSEVEIEVTFVCDSCGVDVETVSRAFKSTTAESDEDGSDNTQRVYEWIENYTETEGRHPSKSKCIQDLPFEIFEAQQLLDELLERNRIVEDEELRAGGKITVFKPEE